jgi:hypothetical protein
MEALRIVQRPRNGRITIKLPEELRIKNKVEIIILPFEEEPKPQKRFDPREFKGASNLNMTIEEIDQECKKLRDEWDRGF